MVVVSVDDDAHAMGICSSLELCEDFLWISHGHISRILVKRSFNSDGVELYLLTPL